MWAKKAYVSSLVLPLPPADFSIVNGDGFTNDVNALQIVEGEAGINEIGVNKNLRVRGAGVFCNFADGLVPKDRNGELSVVTQVQGFVQNTTLTGTLTVTPGSTAVTGVGTLFTAELVPGQIIIEPLSGQALIVQSITNDTALVTRNVPRKLITGGTLYTVTASTADTGGPWPMQNLNEMVEIEEFFTPATFAGSAYTYTIIFAKITVTGSTLNTFTWLTKSIDTSFSGDEVTLDIALDVEY